MHASAAAVGSLDRAFSHYQAALRPAPIGSSGRRACIPRTVPAAGRSNSSWRARAAAAQAALPQHDGFVNGVYHAFMVVRDYELDQFSVVNNAHYAAYAQHARHQALAAVGLAVESFQEEGVLMALTELTLRFKAPLRSGDRFCATVAVAQVGGARVKVDQAVVRCNEGQQPQTVVEGAAEIVFLDGRYRPIRVPGRAQAPLKQLQQEYLAGKQQQQQQQHGAAAAA